MSKLYNTYIELKKQDSQTIYLFKSGIFFLAIDQDAKLLSEIFHFKLGNLTDTIVKCGFPCSSFEKYASLFKIHQLTVKIIEPESRFSCSLKEYKQNQEAIELVKFIMSIDINNLSVADTEI